MKLREYFRTGDAWVWLNAGAVAISLIMVVGLLGLVAVRGLGHFWTADVMQATYADNGVSQVIIGELYDEKVDTATRLREAGVAIPPEVETVTRWSIKQGNKDITGQDFRWVMAAQISNPTYPRDIVKLERLEWGNFYGRLVEVRQAGTTVARGEQAWTEFNQRLARTNAIHERISDIEKGEIGAINYRLEELRLHERRLELDGALNDAARAELTAQRDAQNKLYEVERQKLEALNAELQRDTALFTVADGSQHEIPLGKIVSAVLPNDMGLFAKVGDYGHNLWTFLSADPREANTEGGVFPAIFGTVLMVVLMTLIVTPLGVIAAIYLREYADQGVITQTIRIAVNNLAGVPSIVYGVFGLGFFVYFMGGSIDRLFYPEAAPAPVFGTPGLLWASLTLSLLTLPVVIVSTEEGLSRIPRALKEGSLALGATKAETLWRVVLPMATPSIMTGMILAIARAAGEVAPLMLVGVVKLAPTLPLDMNEPFLHLERKFMHLGFHIYDVGFQSPNVEAARPVVYATAFLLVLVVAVLNLSAVGLRNRLREKYKALES